MFMFVTVVDGDPRALAWRLQVDHVQMPGYTACGRQSQMRHGSLGTSLLSGLPVSLFRNVSFHQTKRILLHRSGLEKLTSWARARRAIHEAPASSPEPGA